MNEPESSLSDATIEAALRHRAPGHVDPAFLREIVTTISATRQVRRRPSSGGLGRRGVLLAAAAATLLIVAGSLAFSGGTRPSPAPSPAASLDVAIASPSGTSPASTSATCATQTLTVLTGNEMPPAGAAPMSVPAGVLDIGVYLTDPVGGLPGGPTDVWAIRSGVATRIARIVGADYNVAKVEDISHDGRRAIIQLGVVHGGLPGPMCDDLYAVRTDGSGVTRVTANGPDQHATDGVLSRDGRYAAYIFSDVTGTNAPIALVDLEGEAAPHFVSCEANIDEIALAWSPLDDRLAASCARSVQVIGVDGSTEGLVTRSDAFDSPVLDPILDIGWSDAKRILLTSVVSGATSNGPIDLTTLTLASRASVGEGTWSPTVVSQPPLFDSGPSISVAIAPDGRRVALTADPTPNDPQEDSLALYAIDTTSGIAERAAGWPARDVGWSKDSRSLVFVDWIDEAPVLTIYDLASRHREPSGTMPTGYRQGIWRGS